MNFKKFISGVSAFAIAASAFAGMAVTANAATTIYSNDFETSSDFTAAGKSDGNNYKLLNPDTSTTKNSKVIGIGSANSGDASLTSPSISAMDGYDNAEIVGVSFDFKMDGCTSGKGSNIALLGGTNANAWLTSTQQIFTISASSNSNGYWNTITANGADIKDAVYENGTGQDIGGLNRGTTGWVTLNAVINFDTEKVTYSMSKGGNVVVAETTADFVNSGVEKLDRIFIAAGKAYGGVLIDNVTVQKLVEPAFTVDSSTTVSVSNTAELDVTDITGTVSATVESTEPTVATGSYADGKLTVNGISAGTAVLTLTATNDGLTTTKTVAVNVGGVTTAKVITNYYITGTETAVPDKAAASVDYVVNTDVEESVIDKNAVIKTDARYVFNSVTINGQAAAFPYTVPSEDDVVINVYFDKQDKVNKLHVSYSNGTEEIGSKDIDLTDKYIGDSVPYYNVAYVKGTDDKLYKYNSLPNTAAGSTVGSNWSYQNPTLVSAENGVATVSLGYTEVANYGFELKETGTGNADQIQSRVSGGNFDNSGSPYALFTVAEAGTYTITVVTAWRSGWSGSGANGSVSVNGVKLEDTVTFTSTAPYKFEYKNVKLAVGDTVTFETAQGRVGVDYALLVKAPSAEVTNTDATTYSGAEYDGEATAAVVAVNYANMFTDNVITLTYNDNTKDVNGATNFTGDGNIVVGVVIEDVADANPVFTAGVK